MKLQSSFHKLQQAAKNGDLESVRQCLTLGVDQSQHPGMPREFSPLMLAASAGHIDIVRLLLEHGANVAFTCGDGFTALTLACEKGHWEIVLLLAENDADFTVPNATGKNGYDYLKSWRCRSKRMRAMIEAKIALNAYKPKEA